MKITTKVPEKGFYYHYKHDSNKGVNDHAYEFVGVGLHTEDNCRPEDENMAIYRPLYQQFATPNANMLFNLRPLEMWFGEVTKDGKTFPRFNKITDPEIISELQKIRATMYEGK